MRLGEGILARDCASLGRESYVIFYEGLTKEDITLNCDSWDGHMWEQKPGSKKRVSPKVWAYLKWKEEYSLSAPTKGTSFVLEWIDV